MTSAWFINVLEADSHRCLKPYSFVGLSTRISNGHCHSLGRECKNVILDVFTNLLKRKWTNDTKTVRKPYAKRTYCCSYVVDLSRRFDVFVIRPHEVLLWIINVLWIDSRMYDIGAWNRNHTVSLACEWLAIEWALSYFVLWIQHRDGIHSLIKSAPRRCEVKNGVLQ